MGVFYRVGWMGGANPPKSIHEQSSGWSLRSLRLRGPTHP